MNSRRMKSLNGYKIIILAANFQIDGTVMRSPLGPILARKQIT